MVSLLRHTVGESEGLAMRSMHPREMAISPRHTIGQFEGPASVPGALER